MEHHYTRSGEPTRDFDGVEWDNQRMPWPPDYALQNARPTRSPLADFDDPVPFPFQTYSRNPRRAPSE